MHSLDQQLAVLNIDPAVFQVYAADTQALDLGAFQLNAGLQRFQNKILVARFPVCGNRLGCRTLFGRCHSARSFLSLWYRYVSISYFCGFQGRFLKKLKSFPQKSALQLFIARRFVRCTPPLHQVGVQPAAVAVPGNALPAAHHAETAFQVQASGGALSCSTVDCSVQYPAFSAAAHSALNS